MWFKKRHTVEELDEIQDKIARFTGHAMRYLQQTDSGDDEERLRQIAYWMAAVKDLKETVI